MLPAILFFATSAVSSSPGFWASTASTEMLATICAEAHDEARRADFCTGYVLATYDTLAINGFICPNPNSSTDQVMALARRRLADHPEDWDKQPSYVLSATFKKVFPCKR
ncbi:Rap1a/Tai family immunity protein [Sphingomonas glacialis]|nr:Rap1a/Tai family immunity protein [Sphingomonas glacialis]